MAHRDRILLLPSVLGLAALVGQVSTSASAQPPPAQGVALQWHAPAPCMDEGALREATSVRLGRSVFEGGESAALVVVGRIEATSDGLWHVSLELRDDAGASLGSRELRSASPNCRDLDEELPIVVALMVDQQRDVALFVPAPEAAVPGATPPVEETPASEPPVAAAPPAPSPWLAIQAGASVSVGDMPEVAVGPQAILAVSFNPWLSVEASATFWPLSSYSLYRGKVALSAWDAGAALCARHRSPRWLSWGGCAGARGGRFQAAGEGFVVNQTGNGARASVVVSVRGQVHLGPVDLVLDVGAGIPLVQNALTVTVGGTTEQVFEPEPVQLLFSLGIRTSGGSQ